MKRFNTAGKCLPARHYRVDLTDRVEEIKEMVDNGDYFCINRGRQYGKTTTLAALAARLADEYTVFSISFEGLGNSAFATEDALVRAFIGCLAQLVEYGGARHVTPKQKALLKLEPAQAKCYSMADARAWIGKFCAAAEKPVAVLIDEVDQASNYDVFVKFLGVLRSTFLARDVIPAFHCVILAGVYDIKHLKAKIRPDSEHQYNSPWNIAVEFEVDMDLHRQGIAGMLAEYEADHHTGMDVDAMAQRLADYTGGYPFLVSRLCQLMDVTLPKQPEFAAPGAAWTKEGFLAAEKLLLQEKNTLFDDFARKLEEYPSLKALLRKLLFLGEDTSFNVYEQAQSQAQMFNYIRNEGNHVVVANRIFETWLYNLFLAEDSMKNMELNASGARDHFQFVEDGRLNLKLLLERFIVHFHDIYGKQPASFVEAEGRNLFMLYLKPLLNGRGHFYVEAETRDSTRMDLVVNYQGEEFIVELKIWRGPEYNEKAERQLCGYLAHRHADTGYLVTFNFNRKSAPGVVVRERDGKTLVEAIV